MSLFDLVTIAVLALFAGVGVLRGAMRELTSLMVWLLAILAGWLFADAVGTWFEGIADLELRRLVAFLAIVLSLLALLTLAVFVLHIFLPRPSPDTKSRVVGAVLGGVRGAFVVLVLVLLAGLTSLPKRADWQDSMLVRVFRPAAEQVLDWLPAPVARQFRYS